jgi:hypothetical protein
MKLIGSKMEQDFRRELINSHKSLFKEGNNQRLLSVLRTYFPNMKTAYFIGHTPEQGEDIYLILIDANIIAVIELNRLNLSAEPIVETISIERYKRGLSKMRQVKLALAIELSQKDLNA